MRSIVDCVIDYNKFTKNIDYNITEGSVVPMQASWMMNFLLTEKKIKKVFEIGFNGGLSSAAILSTRPDITLTSVDIGGHDYVLSAKRLIDKTFPNRHTLLIGDSTMVVPNLKDVLKTMNFDFVFIDGGHQGDVPRLDIENCYELVLPGTYVCIDDWCDAYGGVGVNKAIEDAVNQGKLQTLEHQHSLDRGWGLFRYL